jgi:hypothetical protein
MTGKVIASTNIERDMTVEIGSRGMVAQIITDNGTEYFVPRVACTLEEWIQMLVEMVLKEDENGEVS